MIDRVSIVFETRPFVPSEVSKQEREREREIEADQWVVSMGEEGEEVEVAPTPVDPTEVDDSSFSASSLASFRSNSASSR